jgi:hypothetical protein
LEAESYKATLPQIESADVAVLGEKHMTSHWKRAAAGALSTALALSAAAAPAQARQSNADPMAALGSAKALLRRCADRLPREYAYSKAFAYSTSDAALEAEMVDDEAKQYDYCLRSEEDRITTLKAMLGKLEDAQKTCAAPTEPRVKEVCAQSAEGRRIYGAEAAGVVQQYTAQRGPDGQAAVREAVRKARTEFLAGAAKRYGEFAAKTTQSDLGAKIAAIRSGSVPTLRQMCGAPAPLPRTDAENNAMLLNTSSYYHCFSSAASFRVSLGGPRGQFLDPYTPMVDAVEAVRTLRRTNAAYARLRCSVRSAPGCVPDAEWARIDALVPAEVLRRADVLNAQMEALMAEGEKEKQRWFKR